MQDVPDQPISSVDPPARRPTNVSFHDASSPMNSDAILRKGKWTIEEEDYANKIISLFNRGLLPIGAGTTLRSYLSDKLHCDPMRITKKFAGASCIGKQVFQPSEGLLADRSEEIQELEVLETLFYHRVGDRSGGANRHPVDEDSEFVAGLMQSKSTSSKWNREEGDVDVGSAKSRADFVGKMTEKRHSPSTSGLIGMRSVVSAPDFSELKMLHESTDKTVIGRKRGFQSGKQRSQSVTDFLDFEHYISDDSAAGDLLMQFVNKVTGHQSDDDNNSDENVGESAGPVTKFITSSTIGKNSSNSKGISVKSPGNRNNDSASHFERNTKKMDAIMISGTPIGHEIDITVSDIRTRVSTASSASASASANINTDLGINLSVAESKEGKEHGDEEEENDDEAPPLMVDQSWSLSCHSPQSNIGNNYEDEDSYDCYDSQAQRQVGANFSGHSSSLKSVSASAIASAEISSIGTDSSGPEGQDVISRADPPSSHVHHSHPRTVTEEDPRRDLGNYLTPCQTDTFKFPVTDPSPFLAPAPPPVCVDTKASLHPSLVPPPTPPIVTFETCLDKTQRDDVI